MFTKYAVIVALLGLVCNAVQNFIVPRFTLGGCPKMEVQQNFSAPDYAGTWYIQMQHNLATIHGDGDCAREELVYNLLHNTYDIHYYQKPWSKKQWTSVVGTGFLEGASPEEGKINTIIHNADSCWMMSREQNMSNWTIVDQYYSQVYKVLTDHGIDPYDTDLFTLVDQTNCKT